MTDLPVNPDTKSYWYLATVYTSNPEGIEVAYEQAAFLAGHLVNQGVKVFCPIAHGHSISTHAEIDPLNHDLWLGLDEAFMRSAHGLLVAKMPNWEISKGIKLEIDFFAERKKPIIYWDVKELLGYTTVYRY